jgi:cell division inhibitor SulA
MIESQRFDIQLAFEALETGVFLISVGLEVAVVSTKVKGMFRTGMAMDYIHWLGRLTRSDIAELRFDTQLGWPSEGFIGLKLAIAQVLAARKNLGEKLDEAIRSVLSCGFRRSRPRIPIGSRPPIPI